MPPLLAIRDLAIAFELRGGKLVQAVEGLSLTVRAGQVVALVGESGCGKSVTALSVPGLIPRPPGRIARGRILFDGRDLLQLDPREVLRLRGREIAMIFQEPTTSLNPVYTVGEQVVEAIRLHRRVGRREARELAAEAMHEVGIPDRAAPPWSFPHQFSGGMRQRVMIAMALACRPRLLLADEPTTALDVTIQAQILALLNELRRRTTMAILLISHDLCVVAENADVVCVMHGGRVMEYAAVDALFRSPHHPYTRALLSCMPSLGLCKPRLTTIDEVMSNPDEFRRLPGYRQGVVPWWPHMDPPDTVPGAGAGYALHELEPDHWVGCWRTEYVDAHPAREPA